MTTSRVGGDAHLSVGHVIDLEDVEDGGVRGLGIFWALLIPIWLVREATCDELYSHSRKFPIASISSKFHLQYGRQSARLRVYVWAGYLMTLILLILRPRSQDPVGPNSHTILTVLSQIM